jgi:periplasmic protein TonB
LRRPSPESVSHASALVFTIAVMAATIVREENAPHETAMNNPAIQLEVAPEPAPPAPRVPDPPAPQPPKPRPIRKQEPAHQEAAPASLPLMAETAEAPAVNDPATPPQDSDSQAPAAPDRAAAGTIEAQYAATLRTNIDVRTVVPDSVEYRLRRPKGETRVSFTLDREGSVLEAKVIHTSGWDFLDRQAVGIVKTGRYPPFPQTAFRGESRHSFLVTLEFRS